MMSIALLRFFRPATVYRNSTSAGKISGSRFGASLIVNERGVLHLTALRFIAGFNPASGEKGFEREDKENFAVDWRIWVRGNDCLGHELGTRGGSPGFY